MFFYYPYTETKESEESLNDVETQISDDTLISMRVYGCEGTRDREVDVEQVKR